MEMKELIADLMHLQDDALVQKLSDIGTLRHYRRKEPIIQIGEMQNKIRILVEGVVRCYFTDECGTEITDCFLIEPGYPLMVAAISIPSLMGIHAVVDCDVLEFPMEPVMAMVNDYVDLLWCYNRMLQRALFFHWEIKTSRYCYSASQRYQWFRKKWPNVEAVANSSHIASFLAMTPETLSRLRRSNRDSEHLTQLISVPNSDWNGARVAKCLRESLQDGTRPEDP
jgi:CRP-like cAMP-binding protein